MKKKSFVSRILGVVASGLLSAVAVLGMSISASAADVAPSAPAVAEVAVTQTVEMPEIGNLTAPAPMAMTIAAPRIYRMAAGGAAGGGAAAGGTSAESAYTTTLNFFITWIRRIGAAVALIGAIMFGLALKDNNADQKQNGLMTMVAGFVVVAITLAADMFDLFS